MLTKTLNPKNLWTFVKVHMEDICRAVDDTFQGIQLLEVCLQIEQAGDSPLPWDVLYSQIPWTGRALLLNFAPFYSNSLILWYYYCHSRQTLHFTLVPLQNYHTLKKFQICSVVADSGKDSTTVKWWCEHDWENGKESTLGAWWGGSSWCACPRWSKFKACCLVDLFLELQSINVLWKYHSVDRHWLDLVSFHNIELNLGLYS